MEPTIEEIQSFTQIMKINNTYYTAKGVMIGAVSVAGCYYIGYGSASLYYFVKEKKAARRRKKNLQSIK